MTKFVKCYEPSGAVEIEPGIVLIVEDEKEHPLVVVDFNQPDPVETEHFPPESFAPTLAKKLNDLEGVTVDGDGTYYLTTSHSRNKKGKVKNDREKVLRMRWDGEGFVEPRVITGLRDAIKKLKSKKLVKSLKRKPKKDLGFNIEGLAWHTDGRLRFGLRSPLIRRESGGSGSGKRGRCI